MTRTSKIENTGKVNLSAFPSATENTLENSTWKRWQVKPASVEEQCPAQDTSIQSNSENSNYQKIRTTSIDSGFGSISSADTPDIEYADAQCIANELEKIYNGLFAGGAQLKNLSEARKALEPQGSKDLFKVMTRYGLEHYARGMLESGSQVLDWCEKTPAPEAPSAFIKASKQTDKLRAESDKLTQKTNLKSSSSNIKKAIKKNEELIQYKKSHLEPARREFDRLVYSRIDQLPSYQELKSCLESIKALLPEDVEVKAPIDSTIRTWAFNVLIERGKSVAGLEQSAPQKSLRQIVEQWASFITPY